MLINEGFYVVAWCPFCDQGWVVIAKDKNTKELFLFCIECELEWDNPEDIKREDCGTSDKYGQVEYPTFEEIFSKSWDKFILEDYP